MLNLHPHKNTVRIVWVPDSPRMEMVSLGGAEGFNQAINSGRFFLTSVELSSLVKKLPKEWKPPIINLRSHITNHLGLKYSSKISSGVQVELTSNVGQISPSN